MARAQTFTSYINAELDAGTAGKFQQLERMWDRTTDHIKRSAMETNRATAGLVGGGRSLAGASLGVAAANTRVAATNAAVARTGGVAAASINAGAAASVRMSRDQGALARNLNATATALNVVQGPLGPIAGRVNALSGAVERLTGFRLGIVGVGAAIFALATAGNKATELRSRLAPLYDTQDKINTAFARTVVIARETRTALEPVVALYSRLTLLGRDAGLNQGQIEATTRAASLGARLSGGNAQNQGAALTQLAQGIGSDKLGGDELKSILENAPRIAKAIADGLSETEKFGKVTVGMLRNMGAEGELTAERVTRALGRSLQQLEEEARRLGPTWASATAAFSTELTSTSGKIDQTLGLTRSLAVGLTFVADNMREIAALALGIAAGYAAIKILPKVAEAGAFVNKIVDQHRAQRIAAIAERDAAQTNLSNLKRQNDALLVKRQRIQEVAKAAEADVRATRARLDDGSLAREASIEQRGGFQVGAVRRYNQALADADDAERRLIAIRREATANNVALATSQGRVTSATQRFDDAMKKAFASGSMLRRGATALIGAINPLGIAVALVTTALLEFAFAESQAERNSKALEDAQYKLANAIDYNTGKIIEQNAAKVRGLQLDGRSALAGGIQNYNALRAQVAGTRLKIGGRDAMNPDQDLAEFGGAIGRAHKLNPVEQRADALLKRYASRDVTLSISSLGEQLDNLAKQEPRLRAVADEVGRLGSKVVTSAQSVEQMRANLRIMSGDQSPETRRRAQGDFTGGAPYGRGSRSQAQLIAESEALRTRLRDQRFAAEIQMNENLEKLEARRGKMDADQYVRERAQIGATYDAAVQSIDKREARAGAAAGRREKAEERRAVAAAARGERLAEAARDRADKLAGIMDPFQDDSPNRQLEQALDQAAKAKRAIQDLVGEEIAGIGKFSAEDAAQRVAQVDAAVARTGKRVLDETMDRFMDDSPVRRMRQLAQEAEKAKEAIDGLVGQTVEGYEGSFSAGAAARKKKEIDDYVEAERVRPLTELRRSQDRELAVQQLLLQGRDAEAVALQRKFELQDQIGDVSDEEYERQVQYAQVQQRINALLGERERIVSNLMGAVDATRDTLEGVLTAIQQASPKGVKDALKQAINQFAQTQIRSIVSDLMAGTDERVRNLINGTTKVDTAVSEITTGMSTAGKASLNLADAFNQASARLASGPSDETIESVVSAGAAASPANIAGAVSTALGGTSPNQTFLESMSGILDSLAGEMSWEQRTNGAADPSIGPDDIVVTGRKTIEAIAPSTIAARAKQPSVKEVYNAVGESVGGRIDKALGTNFFQGIGKQFGTALQGAGQGQMASGIARMLGIKQSSMGAALGGAAGSFLPIPGGAFIGGLVGGTLGGMLKKPKTGSATIGGGAYGLDITGTGGNDKAFKAASSAAADTILGQVQQIADQLGATVDPSKGSVSIGMKDGKYRVDPTGKGNVKTKKGAIDFGEDQQAAIAAAVKNLIQDGVLGGISAASQRIIQAGRDLSIALTKAAVIESIPRRLMQLTDPVRFAVTELNREFSQMIAYLKEGGATAEQFADAQKLYDLSRAKAIEEATAAASSQIQSFIDDMVAGPQSPLSRRTVYENSRTNIDKFSADINAGKSVDQGALLDAARNFQDASRALNGSSQAFFTDFSWLFDLLSKARDNSGLNGGNVVELPPSPFTNDPVIQNAIAAASGAQVVAIQGGVEILNATLKDILAKLPGGGGGSGGSSIDLLPGGFGGRVFANEAIR